MTISAVGACSPTSAVTTSSAVSQPRGTGPFEAVSDVLGMSADDIRSAVQDGKSLLDLAKDKGVSSDKLIAALKENAPAEMKSNADFDTIISSIASQTGTTGPGGPGGPPPGPPPSGVMSDNVTDGQQSTLDLLSGLLDVDSDQVISSIKSGTFSDLLSSQGVDLSQLVSTLESASYGSTTGFQLDVRA